MQTEYTATGARVARFTDTYGQQCTAQEYTLDGNRVLWLGVERDPINRLRTRMLLDKDMAARLIPLLEHFAETGCLVCDTIEKGQK